MTDVYDRQAQIEYNREHAGRVVGKAVHPAALDRLFELYPDVKIDVRHEHDALRDSRRPFRPDDHHRVYRVITRVTFWLDGERRASARYVWAKATCHPYDNWDRRAGIKLAFDRALAAARHTHQREVWENATKAASDQRRFIAPRVGRSATAF